ncbi:MAG: MFS transporter [Victivallales bacterium]|nr:MFS transporter [Victivallales bacterium]MCF7888984.1 MFS transporter [Victivallales bacterium]
MTKENNAESNRKMNIVSLCLLLFIDSIGDGIIFPLMPELFFDPVNGLVTGHHTFTRDMLYGIAFAVFPLMGFFSDPGFGTFSDTYGRKKILLIGAGGLAVSYFISILSIILHSYHLFIFSRICSGICSGTYVIAAAAISDMSSGARNKLNNFRWPILVTLCGFIIGPGLSSLVGFLNFHYRLTTPFIIAFILAVSNVILLFFSFRETYTVKKRTSSLYYVLVKSLTSFSYAFREKRIRIHIMGYFLLYFGYGLFFQSISLYLAVTFGFSTSTVGFSFIVLGTALVLSILFIQPFIYKYFNYKRILFFSVLIMGFLLIIQSIGCIMNTFENMQFFWFTAILYFIIHPFASLGYRTLFSQMVSNDEQGLIMGALEQIVSAALFISALLIGHLMRAHDSLIFLLAGISFLISAFTIMFNQKKNQKSLKVRKYPGMN